MTPRKGHLRLLDALEAVHAPWTLDVVGEQIRGCYAGWTAEEAVKSIVAASRLGAGSDELGFRTIGIAMVAGLVFLFLAADLVGNKPVNLACPVTGEAISASAPPSPSATTCWSPWGGRSARSRAPEDSPARTMFR